MEIDKITIKDLSIFDSDDTLSIFSRLNYCVTSRGEAQMRYNLSAPLTGLKQITDAQNAIKYIGEVGDNWPARISNGTIMVVERFFETAFDTIPAQPNAAVAFSYKLASSADFTLIRYSLIHCFDFVKGMLNFAETQLQHNPPYLIKQVLELTLKLTKHVGLNMVRSHTKSAEFTPAKMLTLAHFLRYRFKEESLQMLALYAKLDAWYGMSNAVKKHKLCYPVFVDTEQTLLEATGLYHILLQQPVAYDVNMHNNLNFTFLTGANMAGKSTYIKAVGAAVFLAHTGMGVPAKHMRLTVFDGMLSNINVIDNIAKGESYFFNEVQRIKATVAKVSDGRRWLILIDELFKGTNVQDAMKCSTEVIEGLLKIKNGLFILSTHLYEIGNELKKHSNIDFSYFETDVKNGQLSFNYQLKKGISNDRLGYLILQNAGVVDMLRAL